MILSSLQVPKISVIYKVVIYKIEVDEKYFGDGDTGYIMCASDGRDDKGQSGVKWAVQSGNKNGAFV